MIDPNKIVVKPMPQTVEFQELIKQMQEASTEEEKEIIFSKMQSYMADNN